MRGEGKGSIEILPSGKVRATWGAPDGRRERRTFRDMDDADLWLASKRLEVKRGLWTAPRPPSPQLAEYAQRWVTQRRNRKGQPLKPRTREEYLRTITADFGDLGALPLDAITPDMVRTWYAGMDGHRAAQANAYGLLSAILATAVADDLIDRTPCRIKGGSVKDRATQTEVLSHCDLVHLAEAMPVNYRAIIYVAAYGGLRQGELFALQRSDVDPGGGWVAVRRAVTHTRGETHTGTPKSDAGQRVVTLPPHVAPIVAEHLMLWTGPGDDALVFTSSRGNRLRASTLYRHFYPARESIGRPDLRFHDLRHTGATMAARAGATLRELQARLGHSTVQAAMIYQHATSERDAEIAARITEQATGRRLRAVGD